MSEKASTEKVRYLKGLGAEIVVCPAAAKPVTPDHYVATAKRISEETPNSFYPDQYHHPEDPAAHYRSTAPESWEDTEGKITHFVASIGTGGTISGTSRYLKEMNPGIKIIGADPYGSIFKTYKESGHVPEGTPYLVEGIGQNLPVDNADVNIIDEIINITDRESFDFAVPSGGHRRVAGRRVLSGVVVPALALLAGCSGATRSGRRAVHFGGDRQSYDVQCIGCHDEPVVVRGGAGGC